VTGFGTYRTPKTLRSSMTLNGARCAEPENMWLPWVSSRPSPSVLMAMVSLCVACPVLDECERLYRRVSQDALAMAPGVWAGRYRPH